MNKFIVSLAAAAAIVCAGTVTSASAQNKEPQKVEKKFDKKKGKKTETVTFDCNIHCKNCQKKVESNIPFEKGVKDLQVSVANKQVTITYDPSKTTPEQLAAALAKLGYPATIAEQKK